MTLKSRSLLLLVFFYSIAPPLHAQSAAGTLAYTIVDGEVMLLLSDHAIGKSRQRGWSGFGGTRLDGETLVETAARETEEESRGFYSRALVQHKIREQVPIIDGEFALYFMEVPYVDPAFLYRQPVAGMPEAYHERGPFAWIPWSTVMQELEQRHAGERMKINADLLPGGQASTWYWDIWLGNLLATQRVNGFPWMKK